MTLFLRQLRSWIDDARLRRAARRYRKQLAVIDCLDVPEEFKRAARDQALNRVGAQLEQYLSRP